MTTLTIFMPVLNEAEGLQKIVPFLPRRSDIQWLVADGGSSDSSVETARALGCEVYIQKSKGIRHAYIEAWPLVRGQFVVTFSPDGNCLPEAIPTLLEKIFQGYDMVIASRYLPPAQSDDDDFLTGFGNWLFTALINLIYGSKYTDAMGIYRIYRTDIFYSLGLNEEKPFRFEKSLNTVGGIEPLLSIRAARNRLRLAEIPASEPARFAGERKLQVIKWGLLYLLQTITECFEPKAKLSATDERSKECQKINH